MMEKSKEEEQLARLRDRLGITHNRKFILNKRVQPGDIICERQYRKADPKWTVTDVWIGQHDVIKVRYTGWRPGDWTLLGRGSERVWVDRPIDEVQHG